MIVNNIDILTKYGAIITERNIQACEIITFNDWLDNSLDPIKLAPEKNKYSSINIKLYIEGKNENEILAKISEILNICKSGIIKFNDIDYFYNFFIESHEEELIADFAYTLTLNLKATYKFLKENTISFTDYTKDINMQGNVKTPCIIEIIPNIDLVDLTINGLSNDPIIIKNLHANKKIILNGEDGTITEGGINKFKDTDFWEFPFLLPKTNTIKLSKNNCNIAIKYKPRFL
ncbi:phage distal tail protein [Clostridium perfringens]